MQVSVYTIGLDFLFNVTINADHWRWLSEVKWFYPGDASKTCIYWRDYVKYVEDVHFEP